jgi:F-type H+-transporting ATPase subunit delta
MNNGKPYAKALLDLSKENNIDINQIVSELQLVNSYFDEEFISFLNNPKISKDNKKEVFNKAFNNLNKNVFAVLMVLIDNNKIVYLSEVINELLNLIDEVNNVVTVEVISISKLSEIEKLSITNYFIKKLNKKITLKEVIDEKLVGGLVIKYEGKIIDGSLFTKQESLKEYLKK